jgi:hypothetical protein
MCDRQRNRTQGPTGVSALRSGSVVALDVDMIEQPSPPDFPRPVDPIDTPPPDIKPVPPPDIPPPEGPPDIPPPPRPDRGTAIPAI